MPKKEVPSFFNRNRFAISIATLMGIIVGAGILGIPYVIAKAGYLYGLIIIILIGLAYVFLDLFYGEVVLRTKKQHQLPGYAEKYLGRKGKIIAGIAMPIAVYGALTAYLIGVGQASFAIFKWGTPLLYTIVFFLICTMIVLGGIKAMGKAELFLIPLLLLVVIIIGIVSFSRLDYSSLVPWDIRYSFLPYGVLIFAYMGFAGIPEVREVLGSETKKMKKVIIISALIPIVLYALFAFIVIGAVGLDNFELLQPNERIATVALSIYSHPLLGILANLLAVLAMFTSFLTNAIALKEVYHYDYKLSPVLSIFLTLIVPLLVSVFGLTTFLAVLGFTGAVSGGLEGILVVLMYWRARLLGDRKPEYVLGKQRILGTAFMLMFLFGIIYSLRGIF
ncbi:amino acid permease [Candidatus Woesearchaeota archaeon]|nr:amino acid permease [Candidatus Woesearchaeota archaeon]